MILITGGAGYIGSHVNKFLSNLGYNTIVVDNLVNGYENFVKWGKFIKADLQDKKSLDKIFSENKIDAVMHFAAFAEVNESVNNPNKYYENNVVGSLNLFNSMIEHGVKKIIFSSSCAVYGEPKVIPITENEVKKPTHPYGKSKMMVEEILSDFAKPYNFNSICLRYFNAAGADPEGQIGENHSPESHLIPLVLDAAMGKRQSIKIFGTDYKTKDGTAVRDYIHVNDLANAHYLALKYLDDFTGYEFFNLGLGKGFSVKEVVDTVKKVTKKDFKVELAQRREGDPPELYADTTKITKTLNWKPKYNSLFEIIETAWEWHKHL